MRAAAMQSQTPCNDDNCFMNGMRTAFLGLVMSRRLRVKKIIPLEHVDPGLFEIDDTVVGVNGFRVATVREYLSGVNIAVLHANFVRPQRRVPLIITIERNHRLREVVVLVPRRSTSVVQTGHPAAYCRSGKAAADAATIATATVTAPLLNQRRRWILLGIAVLAVPLFVKLVRSLQAGGHTRSR